MEQPASKKCDVYSYAIILWELATFELPFEGVGELMIPEKVLNGEVHVYNIMYNPVHAHTCTSTYRIAGIIRGGIIFALFAVDAKNTPAKHSGGNRVRSLNTAGG